MDQLKIKVFQSISKESFLVDKFKFEFNKIEEFSNLCGKGSRIVFIKDFRELGISICQTHEEPIKHLITVDVENLEKLDEDTGPYFLLKKYLKCDSKKFILESYEGTFDEKLTSFYVFLDGVIQEDSRLIEVLKGENWIDIFFDWWGAK